MSRLTFRDSKGELWIKDAAHIDEQGQICMLTDRLAAYEDAEEQGLLVALPCKVGADVYCWSATGELQTCKVTDVHISSIAIQIDVRHVKYGELWDEYDFEPDDFGKTVFLTRAEAEAALAKEGT